MPTLGEIAAINQATFAGQEFDPIKLATNINTLQRGQQALQKEQYDLEQKQQNDALDVITSTWKNPVWDSNDPYQIAGVIDSTRQQLQSRGLPISRGGVLDQVEEQVFKSAELRDPRLLQQARNTMRDALVQFGGNRAQNIQGTYNPQTGQQVEADLGGRIRVTNPKTQDGSLPATTGAIQQWETKFADAQKNADVAVNALPLLNEWRGILGEVEAGGGSTVRSKIAQVGQALGMPQSLVDRIAGGDLGAIQLANKYATQAVLQMAQSAGGATAETINQFYKSNPGIDTDPRAQQKFIEFGINLMSRNLRMYKYMSEEAVKPDFNPNRAQFNITNRILEEEGLGHVLNPRARPAETKETPAAGAPSTSAPSKPSSSTGSQAKPRSPAGAQGKPNKQARIVERRQIIDGPNKGKWAVRREGSNEFFLKD